MVDYVLKWDAEGMVRYLYRNDGKHPYVGLMKIESAEWMLRQGEVVVSEEYEGFAVTANGMYFFEAEVNGEGDSAEERREAEGEGTSSVSASADTFHKGEGFGVTCGADYCEISEAAGDGTDGAMIQTGVNAYIVKASDIGAEKPKKRRRRIKDEVLSM